MSIEAGGRIYRCDLTHSGWEMLNFKFQRFFFRDLLEKYFLRKSGKLDQRAEEDRKRITKELSRPLNKGPFYSGNIKKKGWI